MARITTVVAVVAGHDGRAYRNAGERFDVDMDDKRFANSKWFVPVDKAPPPKPAAKNARPPGAGPAKGSGTVTEQMVGSEGQGEF